MIWLQSGVSFLFWLGYGVFQTRRSGAVRQWAQSIPHSRRGIIAAALMLGSIAPVFIVLNLALQYNGFGKNGMTLVVWLGVSAFGLLFVHGQTLATALLVTSAHESVTAGRVQASSSISPPENEDHEASHS